MEGIYEGLIAKESRYAGLVKLIDITPSALERLKVEAPGRPVFITLENLGYGKRKFTVSYLDREATGLDRLLYVDNGVVVACPDSLIVAVVNGQRLEVDPVTQEFRFSGRPLWSVHTAR